MLKKISKIINNHIGSSMLYKCSTRQGKQRQLSCRIKLTTVTSERLLSSLTKCGE